MTEDIDENKKSKIVKTSIRKDITTNELELFITKPIHIVRSDLIKFSLNIS